MNPNVICGLLYGFWLFSDGLWHCAKCVMKMWCSRATETLFSDRSNSTAYRTGRRKCSVPVSLQLRIRWVEQTHLVNWKEKGHSLAPEECCKIDSAQLSVSYFQDSSPPITVKLIFFEHYKRSVRLCTAHFSSSEKSWSLQDSFESISLK